MLYSQIRCWTCRSSQKARNLARDPRIACLVETGEQYFDLRGVQVQGVTQCIEDPAAVREIGRRVAAGMADAPADTLEEYAEHAARKRFGYASEPRRHISWPPPHPFPPPRPSAPPPH